MFNVCALFYGDYFPYAHRLLSSLITSLPYAKGCIADIRLGLNEVSEPTEEAVRHFAKRVSDYFAIDVYVYSSSRNIWKYPMMRRMLHSRELSSHVMWFDDDSYLLNLVDWWPLVASVANQAALVGALYQKSAHLSWLSSLREKSWYQPAEEKSTFTFCTGGWWVLDSLYVKEYAYPFADLIHTGGDVALSELVRHTGGRVVSWSSGVRINAGIGRLDSTAIRRNVLLQPQISEHYVREEHYENSST